MEHAPVVNSQSRVFQNDSKYSKSELQATSDSKKPTLTSQKRNLSHVQSNCSSKTPRTQLPSLRSAAEAKPTNNTSTEFVGKEQLFKGKTTAKPTKGGR